MGIAFVAIGGAIGSVARYLLGLAVERFSATAGVPLGTFLVNVLGCFLVGGALGALGSAAPGSPVANQSLRLLLITGVLGGFTTFSALGGETFLLSREGYFWIATGNVISNILVGLMAVWGGHRLFAYLMGI